MSYAHYFSIGPTLDTMQNIEATVQVPPQYIDTGRVPRIPSVRRRVGSGRMRADGLIQTEGVRFDKLSREEYRALLVRALGSYVTPSRFVYVSWVDDLGFYSPFAAWIDRPERLQDFTPSTLRPTVFPLRDLVLQYGTKTGNYTMTAADRLLFCNTTSGTITGTLPPAANVNAWTPYSVEKTAVANSLILDPDGSETIDGASTLTLTALYAHADFVSDGVSKWFTISDEG